jgi:hypothetical protein
MSSVGTLIVSLKAETAQFATDMGKVESRLDSLEEKAGSAGKKVGSMFENRQSLLLAEEALGVRLPRALNTLIARIPGVGSAFGAMLPLVGVVAAVAIIGTLIQKHKEAEAAARELGNIQSEAATHGAMALQGLGDKLLQAGIKADELSGNHLGALKKQLELLDHQQLSDLIDTFEKFSAEADKTFAKVKAANSWWQVWKSGSDGAKAALDDFKASYDALIAKGDTKGASDKLQGTLDSAVKLQSAQRTYNELLGKQVRTEQEAKALHEAAVLMDQDGIQASKEDLDTQDAVIQALRDQQAAEASIAAAKKTEGGNDKKAEAIAASNRQIADMRRELDLKKQMIEVDAQQAAGKTQLAAINEGSDTVGTKGGGSASQIEANLQTMQAAIEKEKQTAIQAASDELHSKTDLYNASIAELNKELQAKKAAGNADVEAVKENNDAKKKAADEYVAALTASTQKREVAEAEAYKKSVTAAQDAATEKLKIADEENRQEAALKDVMAKMDQSSKLEAIKAEEDANNQSHALGLESERAFIEKKIELTNKEKEAKLQSLSEEMKAQQEAMVKAGENGDSKGQNEAMQNQVKLQTQINSLTSQYRSELQQLDTELKKLEPSWKQTFSSIANDTKTLSSTIKDTLQKSVENFENQFANSMAKCIVQGKNLGQAVRQEAEQMAEAMISAVVKWLEQWIMSHLLAGIASKTQATVSGGAAAGLAAVEYMSAIASAGLPLALTAPAAGAAMYSEGMAMISAETGGTIPGQVGQAIPLLAHGQETVVSQALTDRVNKAERNGGNGGGGDMHMHYSPQVHAMDAEGVDRVLTKHASTFQAHVRSTMRKMNK